MKNFARSAGISVFLMTLVVSASLLMFPNRVDAASRIAINKTNFPDETFRTYVSDYFDKNEDGYLTDAEISKAVIVDVTNMNVTDLKGIEYFTSLSGLYCYNNQLTTLDLSKNVSLENLYCQNNRLTVLDLSKNVNLNELVCSNNQIKTLDLSNNKLLGWLSCKGNQITKLDLNSSYLKYLDCSVNQLTGLKVIPGVTRVDCSHNKLTSLDVSNDAALERLNCSYNRLTTLDLSNNQALTTLDCRYNYLSSKPQVGDNVKVSFDPQYEKITITSQPKDYTGPVGNTATFKVVANTDNLTYQWQTYSAGSWKNSSLNGAKTNSLSVPVTAARDGYKFRCVIKDANGDKVTSKAATLHVAMPVSIISQSKDYSGTIGSKAKFTVVAEGTSLRYQWQTYKNGKWVNSSLTGATTATLTVQVTEARDGYKFRCVITDAYGKKVTSKTVALHVVYPETLTITLQPKNYNGLVGTTAHFTVKAQGTGLKYQWQTYKDGKWVNSSLTGAKTNTLSVYLTKSRNNYKFRCVITDASGNKVISKTAVLEVV